MRPRTGVRITLTNVKQIFNTAIGGQWHAQKKFNGDRCILAVSNGQVTLVNRHGSCLKHPVDNQADFLRLPNDTLLDGEVWKKDFYPFEALIVGGEKLFQRTPKERETAARELVTTLQHEWIFTTITLEWMTECVLKGDRNPVFEGLVLKQANSPYIMLGSENQESPTWQKVKWC